MKCSPASSHTLWEALEPSEPDLAKLLLSSAGVGNAAHLRGGRSSISCTACWRHLPLSWPPIPASDPSLALFNPALFWQGGACGRWWHCVLLLGHPSPEGTHGPGVTFPEWGHPCPLLCAGKTVRKRTLAVQGGEGAPCQPQRMRWPRVCRHMRAPALCCGCKKLWKAFLSTQLQCWGVGLGSGSGGQVHTKLWRPGFGRNC